eukprot:3452786-Lingulodinium_polyedra.AAC.1
MRHRVVLSLWDHRPLLYEPTGANTAQEKDTPLNTSTAGARTLRDPRPRPRLITLRVDTEAGPAL